MRCRFCSKPVVIAEFDDELVKQLQWYECLCRDHAANLVFFQTTATAVPMGLAVGSDLQLGLIDRQSTGK